MSKMASRNETKINGIRYFRSKNHMTQNELADAMGVTQTSVSQWENGRNYPDIKTARRMADYFSTSLDQILSERSLDEFHQMERQVFNNDYAVPEAADTTDVTEESVYLLEQKRLLMRIFDMLSPAARQRVLDRAEAYYDVEKMSREA